MTNREKLRLLSVEKLSITIVNLIAMSPNPCRKCPALSLCRGAAVAHIEGIKYASLDCVNQVAAWLNKEADE